MKRVVLPVNFSDSERFVPDYSNNVHVTRGDTKAYLSFFHTPPPVFVDDNVTEEVLAKLYPDGIKAVCVARVCMDENIASKLIDLLKESIKSLQEHKSEEAEDG